LGLGCQTQGQRVSHGAS